MTGPADVDSHAFVDDLAAPVLAPDDRHHLERVLRIRTGAPITVSDGHGRWRLVRFGPDLEPLGPTELDPAPQPPITIGFALVKGERPELIVQKLTELGVDRVAPFVADRCVVRWDTGRAARHHARLVRIAREAAMQSRRTRLPEIEPLTTFAHLAARPCAALATSGGDAPGLDRPIVLIGPEGGWSPAERARGLPEVGLSPLVLRAETAAIAAGAILAAMRCNLHADGTL
jgi:16S rRNA (uracil1498-N3)-methyltransferase